MPKLKTRKAVAKRVSVTGSGRRTASFLFLTVTEYAFCRIPAALMSVFFQVISESTVFYIRMPAGFLPVTDLEVLYSGT